MTPGRIENTLQKGSAAHTNPSEGTFRQGGLDKLDHRGGVVSTSSTTGVGAVSTSSTTGAGSLDKLDHREE
ncbi:MAG: hypothetical protein ACRDPS_17275 [Nocardioides sp.]|uniref:hypothetical protein n=1 Tax=Nocardioides sp. TaxID=35761 RepID=UPI003D6C193A